MMHAASSSPLQRQRGNALVWVLVLLILAGAGFAAWWFFLRGGGGSASALLQRAIPAEATVVGGLDPQLVLKSQVLTDALAAAGQSIETVKARLAEAKFDLDSLQAVVVGFDPTTQSGVLATQGKLDVATLKGALLALSASAPELGEMANTVQFEGLEGGLVVAGVGDVYTKALAIARGTSTAGLDPKIARIAESVDTGAALWAAGQLPVELTEDMGAAATQLGGTPTHAAISLDMGRKLTIRFAMLAPGMDGAKAATNLEAMMKLAPKAMLPDGASEVLDSLKLTGSGEVLSAEVELDAETLGKLAKTAN